MTEQLPSTLRINKIFNNPFNALQYSIDRLKDGLDESLTASINDYFESYFRIGNPKDDALQRQIEPILNALIALGKKEEAGSLFNIHRVYTQFRGYSPNDNYSFDVIDERETQIIEGCFDGIFEIPKEGVILIDLFACRNLPKIIEILEEREVDLSRIRVRIPQGFLAAQLITSNQEKIREIEIAFGKLNEDQYLIEDVDHVGDIDIEEDVGIWFSPRAMAIYPKLHAETKEETIDNFREVFGNMAKKVVDGGRIFAPWAFSDEHRPLEARFVEEKGKRNLTRIPGISENVAIAVAEVLSESGMWPINESKYNPAIVDSEIDHVKQARQIHMIKLAV